MVTCLVALLPISIGALVTTLKAGMAFADWPTSDGQNMLLYPWLNDLRHTDKFLEHGHRLAGVLIGMVSIALVGLVFWRKTPRWVKGYSIAILIAVICQGLLGGMRVRMDEQVLAMTHSITGGLFFTLCFTFVVLLYSVERSRVESDVRVSPISFGLGLLFPFVVLSQYVLGGFFRHLGRMLHEHVAGAVIVSCLSILLTFVVLRSDISSLRRRGKWLVSALLIQVGLGLGAWVTKLGLPSFGVVAVANSTQQNIVCSLHTVGGMFLLATSAGLAVEMIMCFRAGQLLGLRTMLDPSIVQSQETIA